MARLSVMLRVAVFAPVGLEQDAVDLFEVDGLCAISDGFDERGDAEVARASEDAFAGAYDESERLCCVRRVR